MNKTATRWKEYADNILKDVPATDQRYIDVKRAFYAGGLSVAMDVRDEMFSQSAKGLTVDEQAVVADRIVSTILEIVDENHKMLFSEQLKDRQPVIAEPDRDELGGIIDSIESILRDASKKGIKIDPIAAMIVGHMAMRMYSHRRKHSSAGAVRQIVNAFMTDVRERASKSPAVN